MTEGGHDHPVVLVTAPVDCPEDVLVRIAGDLDVSSLPPIEEALAAAVAADVPAVVVDLTDVGFIGVSGINALVRAANGAHARARGFRVVGASGHLQELCDLLGVRRVLGMVERACR